MKKRLKRFISFITLLAFFIFTTLFPIPHTASASLGSPYGGYDVYEFPCTCDAALFFHIFVPLYIFGIPMPGILVAPVTPVAFTVYYLHPESWALGFEEPGAGTACLIGVEPYCTVVPNYGLITPFTGVSISGSP